MSVHFVTGKLGGGKTLVSVGRIQEYLIAGKKVATNLDLNLEYLIPRDNKTCRIFRIPDKPTIFDLEAIGRGTESKHDEDFGLLVLDELGTWLNSRTYQKDRGRQDVIDWFLHARHLGWDVFLIVQDPELIDKQVRISLGEHVVICRRTDRIPLPIISFIFKVFTGYHIKLPRVHVGSVFYGSPGVGGIKVDTWMYKGNNLFKAYDTSQIFKDGPNRTAQFIPPYFLNQKRFAVKNTRFYMRLTKIYFKRYKTPLAFGLGVVLNFVFLAILFVFYGGSANADLDSVVIPPAPKSSNIIANQKIVLESKINPDDFELVQISYSQIFVNGKASTRFFYNGIMYSSRNFPEKITWINRTPYYYSAVEKQKAKHDQTGKTEPVDLVNRVKNNNAS